MCFFLAFLDSKIRLHFSHFMSISVYSLTGGLPLFSSLSLSFSDSLIFTLYDILSPCADRMKVLSSTLSVHAYADISFEYHVSAVKAG